MHHHGCRVGMMTHRIACWRAPPQTRCRGGDLFIHVSLGQLFYTFAGTIGGGGIVGKHVWVTVVACTCMLS